MNAALTPETIAELRRLLDECQPGRVIVNDLRPTHDAIWLDSRYDSDDGWERLRTLAEIDAETETVEVLWGLDDAVLIAAAINALPALLDAAAERDALAARLEGAEAVIEVQDAHARLVIAERDEAMRALGKLAAERDAEPDRIAELAAERDALAAERDRLREQVESMRCAERLSIMSGWLVYEVGEHTCGGYGPESGYMHEPGCGYEPIVDLSKMEGWPGADRDALDAAEARLAAVREVVHRGARCPMCSSGMERRTVGMVCQLCGTDYGRADA